MLIITSYLWRRNKKPFYILMLAFEMTELLTGLSDGSLDSRPDLASWFAGFYLAQGRYIEAEKLYERALAGREERLGPKHPDTLGTVHGLANFFRGQGRLDEARSLQERI